MLMKAKVSPIETDQKVNPYFKAKSPEIEEPSPAKPVNPIKPKQKLFTEFTTKLDRPRTTIQMSCSLQNLSEQNEKKHFCKERQKRI